MKPRMSYDPTVKPNRPVEASRDIPHAPSDALERIAVAVEKIADLLDKLTSLVIPEIEAEIERKKAYEFERAANAAKPFDTEPHAPIG